VLAVDDFRIQDTPSTTLTFSQLRRLALSCPPNIADLSTFLQHAEIPLLEDLALTSSDSDYNRKMTQDDLHLLGRSIRRHADKVKRFSFGMVPSYRPLSLPQDVWSSFTALELLVLENEAPVDMILSSLPTSRLTSFRLRSPFENDEKPRLKGLLDALRSQIRPLDSLFELILPIHQASKGESEDEIELVELCRERGIKMLRRQPFSGTDYEALLEDSLDFW